MRSMESWTHGDAQACQRALAYGPLDARRHRKPARPCRSCAKASWEGFICVKAEVHLRFCTARRGQL